MKLRKQLSVWFLIFLSNGLFAQLKLPAVISDNMVLQQQANVTIWGWARAAEKITIKADWYDQDIETVSDVDGKWMTKVKTPFAGGPYNLLISNEQDQIKIKNILIGEVWLASGQSNMELSLKSSENGTEEVALSAYPQIRLFTVEKKLSGKPLKDIKGSWIICCPETAANFSAVAYYFGREIHKKLSAPIGLIGCSWGGTPIQSWMKKEVLSADINFEYYFEKDDHDEAIKSKSQKEYNEALEKWQRQVDTAKKASRKTPRKPSTPGPLRLQNRCSVLYNGMVKPLIPFAIKGVIWYQGESNAGDAYLYRKTFPAMINSWREDWNQGDFPFYFVQLSNFYKNMRENRPTKMPDIGQPQGSNWAELREAQLMTLSLPNTGMVVTMDIGDCYDIHPRDKKNVGKRLALWAMAKDYGYKNIVYSGPLYKEMEIEGNKIRLLFDNVGSGLMAKDGMLKGFAIAGEDQRFVWADAKIDGDTVLVWSEQIEKPVATRYAWSKWIPCNLFNREDLPASPFRTDNWLCITKRK